MSGYRQLSSDAVTTVDVFEVTLPLANPVQVGHMTIHSREYAVIRLRTGSGREGKAYALTRGTPVCDLIADDLAPLLIGTRLHEPARFAARARRERPGCSTEGPFVRGLGLIDIALWDLRAQVAQMPVWAMLGGARETVPVMVVVDYQHKGIGPDDVAQQVVTYSQLGHPLVKLAAPTDPADLETVLSRCTPSLTPQTTLVIDAAWRWATALAARDELLEVLNHRPIAWLEDPFDLSKTAQYQVARQELKVPLGAGDEASNAAALTALAASGNLDVVRVDIPALGGLTAAVQVAQFASSHGLRVSPHVYPHVSIHLAAAVDACDHIETFTTPGSGLDLDPIRQLITWDVDTSSIEYAAPTDPGLGFNFDWPSLEARSSRKMTCRERA
jgi:L-alanine-DL-glutamate epimerase-like enolase superfamily enzyme